MEPPPNSSMRTLITACRKGTGGNPLTKSWKDGLSPSIVLALCTSCRRGKGEGGDQ